MNNTDKVTNKFTGKYLTLTFHEGVVAAPFDLNANQFKTLWVHLSLTPEGGRELQKLVLSFAANENPLERKFELKCSPIITIAQLTIDIAPEVTKRLGEIINTFSSVQLSKLLENLWFEGEDAVAFIRAREK